MMLLRAWRAGAVRAAVCAIGLIALGPSSSARAQDAGGSAPAFPLTGSFSYVLVSDSSDVIKTAVDRTVASMNFIVRPIARGRLNRTNPTPQRMRVTLTRDSVAVAFDDGNAVVTPFNGHTVPWLNSMTQETYQVHAVVAKDTIRQAIAAPDGVRENAYIFSTDGDRVHLHVTVTSHRLPKPLVYTLLFRRAPGTHA